MLCFSTSLSHSQHSNTPNFLSLSKNGSPKLDCCDSLVNGHIVVFMLRRGSVSGTVSEEVAEDESTTNSCSDFSFSETTGHCNISDDGELSSVGFSRLGLDSDVDLIFPVGRAVGERRRIEQVGIEEGSFGRRSSCRGNGGGDVGEKVADE